MRFTFFEDFYWAAGFFVNLALLMVLLVRGRWRTFPILTTWMAFQLLRTTLLFLIYESSPMHLSSYPTWAWYNRTYIAGAGIDFILQLGVVFEIARIVLRPTGTWARDARMQFLSAGLGGAAVAALFAWWVSPPARTVQETWPIRGNLFTSLVICELFVVMTLTSNRLGLGWRNHVMAIGQGLTAWSTIMVVKTAIQSFFGTQRYYYQLDQFRSIIYIAAACWMVLQLWRDEPERKPISAGLQEYILALHSRVEYDLRRLDAGH
jgi:hypothetical protein